MPRSEYSPTTPDERRMTAVFGRIIRRQTQLNEDKQTAAVEADGIGMPITFIAEQLDVDRRTVYRWVGRPVARKAAS